VSVDIRSGELVTVIGANGAGKTSLLRALSGLLPIREGEVMFEGRPIAHRPAYLLARDGLVHVPQGRQIIPGLTVRDNLLLGAYHVRLSGDELESRLEQELARFPVLRARQLLPGGSLSGGEQQMLAVSRGLMMKPKVLLLDEPSLGLAPQIVRTILRTLRELADGGLAVLLVEQAAVLALDYADRAVVLRNGQCVLEGNASSLRGDRAVVESYLA
jgi:branched-chain amino acid transport system ATP-binding protein